MFAGKCADPFCCESGSEFVVFSTFSRTHRHWLCVEHARRLRAAQVATPIVGRRR